ncbi:MAG: TRAP transporter substrate-binding protein DctP [Deltaproteobacteria bacterium]|nr:TRAP transporter substrate-binding protein DctP [Deltaproteobacteria bacterium]
MGKKHLLFAIVMVMFLLCTCIMSAGSASAKTFTISALTAWPKSAFESQQFLKFLENVQREADKRYPGELKMVYKGAGEVIRNREQVEACRSGLIDMVYTAGSYYTSILPEIDTMSLTTMRPWEEREAGVFDYLDSLHRKKANTHMLGRTGTGSFFHLFLSKPIEKVADLKGRKIRCSPTTIPFMKAVGAVPIGMPPPDIYTAMERGVVDGYILPPGTIRDFGLVPVSKYIVFPGFYEPCQFVLINLDVWNKLPKHLQNLLTEETKKFARFNIENQQKQLKSELAKFKKEGMTFITLEGQEGKKFKKMANDALYQVVLKKAPVVAKKIREMITKK